MKPTLKGKTETITKVAWHDLEDFIKQVTGHEYETVANEEWGNDSQHRFDVTGKLSYDAEDWEEFKKTGKADCYRLSAILNGLCNDGHIPAGVYLITVCW